MRCARGNAQCVVAEAFFVFVFVARVGNDSIQRETDRYLRVGRCRGPVHKTEVANCELFRCLGQVLWSVAASDELVISRAAKSTLR